MAERSCIQVVEGKERWGRIITGKLEAFIDFIKVSKFSVKSLYVPCKLQCLQTCTHLQTFYRPHEMSVDLTTFYVKRSHKMS